MDLREAGKKSILLPTFGSLSLNDDTGVDSEALSQQDAFEIGLLRAELASKVSELLGTTNLKKRH